MLRRKIKAARERAQKAALLEADREKSKQKKYKKPKEFKQLAPRKYHEVYDPAAVQVATLPSKPIEGGVFISGKTRDDRLIDDPEWAAREQKAQEEKKRKSKMLVPMYNKGPVQYIGGIEDPAVIRDLGKKV